MSEKVSKTKESYQIEDFPLLFGKYSPIMVINDNRYQSETLNIFIKEDSDLKTFLDRMREKVKGQTIKMDTWVRVLGRWIASDEKVPIKTHLQDWFFSQDKGKEPIIEGKTTEMLRWLDRLDKKYSIPCIGGFFRSFSFTLTVKYLKENMHARYVDAYMENILPKLTIEDVVFIGDVDYLRMVHKSGKGISKICARIAATMGYKECLEYILKLGEKVDYGVYVSAVVNKNIDCLECLPTSNNSLDVATQLAIAIEHNLFEMVDYFIKPGGKSDLTTMDKSNIDSMVRTAVHFNQFDMFKWIVDRIVKVKGSDILNDLGSTCYEIWTFRKWDFFIYLRKFKTTKFIVYPHRRHECGDGYSKQSMFMESHGFKKFR